MYVFKSCPKCHGDLAVERDGATAHRLSAETEFSCLQCGYYLVPDERRALAGRIIQFLHGRRTADAASSTAA